MPDQSVIRDAGPPNSNPTTSQQRWWRAAASLLITVTTAVAAFFIFLLLHATAVPDVHVDSASSLSLSLENAKTTTIRGDFIFCIKNHSPFVSVKHMDVKLNIYYNQKLVSSNLSVKPFVVGRLKKVCFTSATNSTASHKMRRSKRVAVGVELEAKRRLGIIGDWWIFAFTLYASCDDNMVFERSASDGGRKWTPSGNHGCSVDSFFDYV